MKRLNLVHLGVKLRNEPGNEPYMTSPRISHYALPEQWTRYDLAAVSGPLIEAKTAAGVLNRMPRLPQWIEQAHEEQLRLEAVGTSRIEGAEFTEREQEEALAPGAEFRIDLTRSQRQLRADHREHEADALPPIRNVAVRTAPQPPPKAVGG